MKRHGVAIRIVFYFATIPVIGVNTLKAKQRHRNVVRAGFADAGKTEEGERRRVAGDEVAMVRSAILFDKPHPHLRIVLKLRGLSRSNRVTQEAGNQSVVSVRWLAAIV